MAIRVRGILDRLGSSTPTLFPHAGRGSGRERRALRLSPTEGQAWPAYRACLFVLALFFLPVYSCPAFAQSRRRRSRRLATEQGAAADNACRGGAPGGAGLLRRGPARPGTPTTLKALGPGILARRLAGLPAWGASQGSPAPPGAPSPH